MRRRIAFAPALLISVALLAGCNNSADKNSEPESTSASQSADASDGGSSKATSNVDSDLREQIGKIVRDNVAAGNTISENTSKILDEANEYIDEHEPGANTDSDNPFVVFERFSDETNKKLFEIYSQDSDLLKYFDVEGLEPHEKTAIALWSQTMPYIFTPGEAVIPDAAFSVNGDTATVDLGQGTVTVQGNSGDLIMSNKELAKLPMVKIDGKWLIDSKAYYTQLKNITT